MSEHRSEFETNSERISSTPNESRSVRDRLTEMPNGRLTVPQWRHNTRLENRRWWIKLLFQPLLFLMFGALLLTGLGIAQRYGVLVSHGPSERVDTNAAQAATRYICPMMCTPPQTEPGRCPVCAMELVPAATDTDSNDSHSVQITPAARRLANIQTSPAVSIALTRTVRAIGELTYDEGSLKTIASYVDGRLDRLYADYTGVVVEKGDHLALVYSPQLYSGQVELLLAKTACQNGQSSTLKRVVKSSHAMYVSARQRLIELGMTESQIEQLEAAGEANSRMRLCAPICGTVIEKCAVEGEYVKEGQTIYRLADLSTVWLMLELFPQDVANIRHGQTVQAEVQSLPGQVFAGNVAFIDPKVDPKTRTVGVRVVIDNKDGLLRVGDYAHATMDVALPNQHEALVVPRDAVLMVGQNSALYVETDPGRFELRRVVLGPEVGDQIVILRGVTEGEQVATRGNFLIDSQMQLAGHPSLIDPNKLRTQNAAQRGAGAAVEVDSHNLPPIGPPQLFESQEGLPPILPPQEIMRPEGEATDSDEATYPTADLPMEVVR